MSFEPVIRTTSGIRLRCNGDSPPRTVTFLHTRSIHVYGPPAARSALRFPDLSEVAALRCHCHPLAGFWNRREHCDLHLGRPAPAAPPAGERSRSARDALGSRTPLRE